MVCHNDLDSQPIIMHTDPRAQESQCRATKSKDENHKSKLYCVANNGRLTVSPAPFAHAISVLLVVTDSLCMSARSPALSPCAVCVLVFFPLFQAITMHWLSLRQTCRIKNTIPCFLPNALTNHHHAHESPTSNANQMSEQTAWAAEVDAVQM